MPKSRHAGRHAQRPSMRYRLKHAPTTLAVAGIVALFVASAALAIHVLTVPSSLRAESTPPTLTRAAADGASHPTAGPTRAKQSRATRSEQTRSPRPHAIAATALTPRKTRGASPTPTPSTDSARPTPRPSSSSSSPPLPLPTFTFG